MDRTFARWVAGIGGALALMFVAEAQVRSGPELPLMLALMAAMVAAAVGVWRRPEARWLAAWAVVGVCVAFGVVFGVDHELAWYSPWLLVGGGGFALVVLPAAGWIAHALACRGAAVAADAVHDGPRARALRIVVRVVLVAGAVALAFGLLPGWREYADSNDCVGHAFGSLVGGGHGHRGGCAADYSDLVAERAAGGIPLWIFLGAALAPGVAVAADPRRRWLVIAWVPTMLAGGMLALLASFDLHLFTHVVELWPVRVVRTAVGVVLLLVGIGAPLVAFVVPATRPPSLPAARVV